MTRPQTPVAGIGARQESGWTESCCLFALMSYRLLSRPVIKLTSAGSCSKDIIKSICKLWLKSEKELFGRCIYSAPGEGHWYEYYRQEDVPYFALDENWRLVCVSGSAPPVTTMATLSVVWTRMARPSFTMRTIRWRCCPALVANLLSNLLPPRKGRSNMGL